MTLPANVRVNAQFPFPATVTGAAPIAIAKASGIWTVLLNFVGLGTTIPLAGSYNTDYILVYDSIAGTFSKVALGSLGLGTARVQRSVTSSPIAVAGTDQIINVNIAAGSPTCLLPAFASRAGAPLTIKDVGGQFAAHNLTITPADGLIDGLATLVLKTNYQAVTLVPFNDGVNSGWAIE